MLTTVERVRTMGTEFTTVSDDSLTMYIEDASLEVSSLSVPEAHKERLTRYLAAHLATFNNPRVIKEKVDVIERSYSDSGGLDGLLSTKYGQEYQRILEELVVTEPKKTINLMVL